MEIVKFCFVKKSTDPKLLIWTFIGTIFLESSFYVKNKKDFLSITLLYHYPLFLSKKNSFGFNSKIKKSKKLPKTKTTMIKIFQKCKNSSILSKQQMKNSLFSKVKNCVNFTYLLFLVIKNIQNPFKNRISVSKDLWERDWKFQENQITNMF